MLASVCIVCICVRVPLCILLSLSLSLCVFMDFVSYVRLPFNIIQLPQEFKGDLIRPHRMQIHLFIHEKIRYIIIETDVEGKSAYFLCIMLESIANSIHAFDFHNVYEQTKHTHIICYIRRVQALMLLVSHHL